MNGIYFVSELLTFGIFAVLGLSARRWDDAMGQAGADRFGGSVRHQFAHGAGEPCSVCWHGLPGAGPFTGLLSQSVSWGPCSGWPGTGKRKDKNSRRTLCSL